MTEIFSRIMNHVTVEPAFFLFTSISAVLDSAHLKLLAIKKCQVTESKSHLSCNDADVFHLLSDVDLLHDVCIILSIIPTILLLCWSDKAGRHRKPLIFPPIIGLILQSLLGLIQAYFLVWISALNVVLSNIAFKVMSGGILLMTMVSLTYLCDISNDDHRCMRIGLFLAVKAFGSCVGLASWEFFFIDRGFMYVFSVCFSLSLLSLVLALDFVKDVSVPVIERQRCCDLFELKRVAEIFNVVFGKKPGRSRIIVVSSLTVIFLNFATQGESNVLRILLERKLNWNDRECNLFWIFKHISEVVGVLFCSIILNKMCKVNDALVGIFAASWSIVSDVGYLAANQSAHFYMALFYDAFQLVILSVAISFLSKCYKCDEYGRVSSMICIFSLVIPLSREVYDMIFRHTWSSFPSACFLLSIIVGVIIFLLYCVIFIKSKKLEKQETRIKEEKMDNRSLAITQ